MSNFVGVLRTNEGTVISSDINNLSSNQTDIDQINALKINKWNVTVINGDPKTAKLFCKKLLLSIKDGGQFDKIIAEAKQLLKREASKYQTKLNEITFVGYEYNFSERPFYALTSTGEEVENINEDRKSFFSINNDLGAFLSNKVYSKHMSLERAINLLAYITAQYDKIVDIGKDFVLITITKNGYHRLGVDEAKKIMANAELIHQNMRKLCYDFFI